MNANEKLNDNILEKEQIVYDKLNSLNIKYEVFEHEPIFTADQLYLIKDIAKGNHCKNLFLKNSKGDKHYILVIRDDKSANLKSVKEQIQSTRLSFESPEKLMDMLQLTPGSVNPFSIINDKNKEVEILVDSDVLDGQNLNFHPNINTKMVNLSLDDFKEFMDFMGYNIRAVEI